MQVLPASVGAFVRRLVYMALCSGLLASFGHAATVTPFVTGLNSAYGLAFDATGNLYVADPQAGKIVKVTSGGSTSDFELLGDFPNSVVFDGSGNLFVGHQSTGEISKVTIAGGVSTGVTSFASVSGNPQGMAFNGAGDLFVANSATEKISKVTSAGVVSDFVSSGLSQPQGLAFDTNGNLFVANGGNGKISKVTSGGVVSDFVIGFAYPVGLVFDSAGNLLVSDAGAGSVSRVAISGGVSTGVTLLVSGFTQPTQMAFDGSGVLYVADYTGGSVSKVTDLPPTAPTLTTPTFTNLGANQVTLTFQSSATGTGYFTILAAGETAGTAIQTKEGKKSTGALAFRHGSLPLTAATNSTYTVRNLAAGTPYTVCFTADDGTTLADGVESSLSFTTTAATSLTGAAWTPVGTAGFSGDQTGYTNLAFDPTGTPYVGFRDSANSNKITVMKYTAGAWTLVGTAGFSAEEVSESSLAFAPDGTPYVVYRDAVTFKPTAMKYTGGAWALVGAAGFSAGGSQYYSSLVFAPDGTPYLSYRDTTNKATVMKFDGAAWVVVGAASFTSGVANDKSMAIAPDGTPHIAYQDFAQAGKVTVMKYTGAAWTLVGTAGISTGSATNESLKFAPDGTLYVAFRDVGNASKATVMKFNGAAWEAMGAAGFSSGEATFTSLAFAPDGTPYVAFEDGANGTKATVMRFNGATWETAGTAGFSGGEAMYTSLAFAPEGTPFIAYRDLSNGGKATVMKLALTAVASVTVPANATYAAGQALNFTVHFDSSVTVDFTGGRPRIPLNIGGTTVYADYVSGTDSTDLVFRYTVQSGDSDSDGITVGGSIDLNGGTILTTVGSNPVVLTLSGVGSTVGIDVDTRPTLTTPATSHLGANQVTLTFQSSATGTGYFTILAAGETAGTAIQTKEGKKSTGALAFRHGSLALTAATAGTYTVRNLAAGTPYTVCFTADDGTTLADGVDATVSFTTTAAQDLTHFDWTAVGAAGFSADQALSTSLAFAPDGTPTIAYMDNSVGNKATVMQFNGTAWEDVGTAGFSAGEALYTNLAFAPDGTPHVAYTDEGNDRKITVMKYSGAAWTAVGAVGISAGTALTPSLAFAPDGTPYVAYHDTVNGTKATVLKFNGSAWVPVGSIGFSAGEALYTSLAFAPDGAPHVAYRDEGNSWKATVMRFNGTAWEDVGTAGFSTGAVDFPSLAFAPNGTPTLAFGDDSLGRKATVMQYNGAAWQAVGSAGFSAGQTQYTNLAFAPDGTPFVAYQDWAAADRASVMKFNGTAWVAAGRSAFSPNQAMFPSLAIAPSGTPYLAYSDGDSSSKATVMKMELVPEPIVTALSAAVGRTSGGMAITITGTYFTRATAVHFGATSAGSLTVNSDTAITVTVPAGAAGTVDVTVTTIGGTSATSADDQFTYVVPVASASVTSNAGSGTGTLREAIDTIASGGTITVAAGLSGETITLTSPLEILQDLTLDGSAPATPVTISGNDQTTVFHIGAGITAYLAHLNIVEGKAAIPGGFGGGIFNEGTLTVEDCTLSSNSADANGCGGGAIANSGTVTVRQCILSGNTANAGGGGAILNIYAGVVTVEDSTLSGNSGYYGGAIYNDSSCTLVLHNTTLAGNSASNAGGIYNEGPLTLLNCTLSGNTATSGSTSWGGGAIYHGNNTATLDHCTIVENLAGAPSEATSGIWLRGGTLTLGNNIVANNGVSGTANFAVSGGTFTSLGHNLSNAWNGQTTTTGDLTAAPLLAALADNGGDTQTCALQVTSPALNAADPADATTTDQRGVSRPQGYASDIGAYEMMSDVASVSVPPNGTYAPGEALNFTVSFGSAVTVDFTGGRPRIPLTIGGTTVYAEYLTGSGTTNLVFRYWVQSSDADSDGITVGGLIDLHGGTILTTVGNNPVALILSGVGSTVGIHVATPPAVTSVSPTNGPTTGGTSVILTGTYFTAATAVQFGTDNAASYTVDSATQITAVAPAHAAGIVHLTVTTAGGTSATSANDQFTFVVPSATASVTSTANDGPGSLREALRLVASGGTITLAAGLSGQTVTLVTPLAIDHDLSIDGSALASHVKISGNGTTGVFTVASGSTATLTHLDIIDGNNGNPAGGIFNEGTLTLQVCTLSGNQGAIGGIYNTGTLTVQNSTFAANTGDSYSGGICNLGTATLTNCTFSGNQSNGTDADMGGGAFLQASGTAVINHCTIVNNLAAASRDPASGLFVSGGTLTLNNSIVASNGATGTGNFSVIGGTFTSLGHNLSNAWNGQTTTTGDLTAAPLLAALADNGGDTQTCALQVTSPALNAADPADATTTDQRGVSRPQGYASDIGAYETLSDVSSVSVPASGTYAPGEALNFTVSFGSAVTVDLTGGRPRIPLNIGGTTVYADYLSGSGTTNLVFRYTVQSGDADSDGITVGGLIDLHGGTILTTVGSNPVALVLDGVGSTIGVDVAAPVGPTLTPPATSNLGANQVTLTFQSSATGRGYFTILATGETAGTAIQTKEGKKSTGALAFRHGSLPLTAATAGTYTVRNLAAATHYTVCFTADDGTTLAAGVDSSVTFTTTAAANLTGLDWFNGAAPGYNLSLGAGHTIASSSLAFASDGLATVAFTKAEDSDSVYVSKYTGTDFSMVTGLSNWEILGPDNGSPISAGTASALSLALAPDGTPYLAYRDEANGDKATLMKYDGTAWDPVGTAGFSADTADHTSLAFSPDGTPYVALGDGANGGRATVMRFDGSSWEIVGSAGFSAGAASATTLVFAPDGLPYVAFRDEGHSSKATVMRLNNSTWETVGSAGFSTGAASFLDAAFSSAGVFYVAYQDAGNSAKATVMRLNGSTWANVGSAGFSAGHADSLQLALAPDGTPYVAFRDGSLGSMTTVMRFTGTGDSGWATVSTPGFSSDFHDLAFDPAGTPHVTCTSDGHPTIMNLAPVVLSYTVTTTADHGPGSLREGLATVASGSTIDFALNLSAQTITLESPLAIVRNVTIDGSTLAAQVRISGDNKFQVFIVVGPTATLGHLNISDGYMPNNNNLESMGGGILNAAATLTVQHCTLSGNSAAAGGAIANFAGALTLRESTVSGNSAGEAGGGIFNILFGVMTVQDCTITDNSATTGGAIGSYFGDLTIENSTLSGNSSGILLNQNTDNRTSINHCTIIDNTTGFGLLMDGGTLTLGNSIVANNGAGGTNNFGVEGNGTFTSLGYNLSNNWNTLTTTTGDLTSNPLLAALADNGGPTQTHALQPGSPALNAADPADATTSDQRGIARPQSARSDIGAYEVNGPVQKATLVLTWHQPADLTYGSSLSATQLNASANVAGTFVYNPPAGTVLGAGTGQTLRATFTPTDAANYESATVSTTITVERDGQTIDFAPLPDLSAPPASLALGASASSGLRVSYSVSGPARVSGSALTFTGTGEIVVTASQPGDLNYTAAADVTRRFTVSKLLASVSLGNLTSTYNANPHAATATTTPAGLKVNLTYAGSPTAPTAAGSYAVVATITEPNYAGEATGTLVIAKAPPSLTWPAPAAIVYGTALSATQLNATSSVPGTVTYTPAAGTVLQAGSHSLSATFTPTDSVNYMPATAQTTITITAPTAPTIVTQPSSQSTTSGGTVTVSVTATGEGLSYQWYRQGHMVPGATSPTLTLPEAGPPVAGIYDCVVSGAGSSLLSHPVVVGIEPAADLRTAGSVTTRAEWQDIHHSNGHTYDQFLLTGAAGTFTADPDQIARCSYLDTNNSIVQVEMSGAGAITIALDPTTVAGPLAPALYNQSGIEYMKGKATVILAGADATTHFTIYSVGSAHNPAVIRPDATYAGWADVAAAGIMSSDRGLGGIHQGNVAYNADIGFTGIYAPTVDSVGGLVVVHGIEASGSALPYLCFGPGGAVNVKIAGTSLAQLHGNNITVGGLSKVTMGAGQDSCGRDAPAQAIQTALLDGSGEDVTAELVTPDLHFPGGVIAPDLVEPAQ